MRFLLFLLPAVTGELVPAINVTLDIGAGTYRNRERCGNLLLHARTL